ncbi:MAG: prepilin-type N-terminal cleavage/methylation domain-containing protein [Nitrospinae bacterium]|nr:prepilin-type N-terminal cleavage/methylation domain-containing protein [Nitrospinota bacterium]
MGQRGFTFIELVLVIVMIGILSSIAAQKMISVAEDVAIAAEDATVETLRKNLTSSVSEAMFKGEPGKYPADPFVNLGRTPEGYNRRRSIRPTGDPVDDGLWVYVTGSSGINLTPEEAGTTLSSFTTSGFVYHQRNDHTVVKWAYDSINGLISPKIIESESELKRQLDLEKKLRGEETEKEKARRLQPQGASGVK